MKQKINIIVYYSIFCFYDIRLILNSETKLRSSMLLLILMNNQFYIYNVAKILFKIFPSLKYVQTKCMFIKLTYHFVLCQN